MPRGRALVRLGHSSPRTALAVAHYKRWCFTCQKKAQAPSSPRPATRDSAVRSCARVRRLLIISIRRGSIFVPRASDSSRVGQASWNAVTWDLVRLFLPIVRSPLSAAGTQNGGSPHGLQHDASICQYLLRNTGDGQALLASSWPSGACSSRWLGRFIHTKRIRRSSPGKPPRPAPAHTGCSCPRTPPHSVPTLLQWKIPYGLFGPAQAAGYKMYDVQSHM